MDSFDTLNQWAEFWLALMAYQVLDSAFVFAAVGLIWLLIRKRASVQFGYVLFLLVLIKLLIPAPISLPALFLDFSPQPLVIQEGERTRWFWERGNASPEEMSTPREPILSTVPPTPSSTLTGFAYLMITWATLALLFVLHLARVIWKTRCLIAHTVPLSPPLIPFDLQSLQQTAGIKRRVRWVTGDWVKSPLAYGCLHPVIVVPPDLRVNFTPNQIRWILLHELAHIRRGDAYVALFQKFIGTLFFFNPLVWWVDAIIDHLREYACDDAALVGSQSSPKECGEGFLGMVMRINHMPRFPLSTQGMIDYETMISRRLLRMLNKGRILESRLSAGSALLLLLIAILVLPVGMKLAYAQLMQWTPIPADDQDKPMSGAAKNIAYDTNRGTTLLYGGVFWGGFNPIDTWEWDGKRWRKISEVGPQRHSAGMAYDRSRNVTVLYGGYNLMTAGGATIDLNTYGAVTWEWDVEEWKEADLADNQPRVNTPLVYFPELNCVVRHGGADGYYDDNNRTYGVIFNDTYRWDGMQWIKIAEGPTRAGHEMVYDSIRKKVILFGGFDAYDSYPEDTWEFDGSTWVPLATEGPPGRYYHGFAFDDSRGVAVLYGGTRWDSERWYGDLWEWDGKTWREMNIPTPGFAWSANMVYDRRQQKIILYLSVGRGTGMEWRGNQANLELMQETWEYAPVVPSGFAWPFAEPQQKIVTRHGREEYINKQYHSSP